MLTKDFREFLELLDKNKVEYLVVGGYAVAFHGYPRYTGDLNIWFGATEENTDRLLLALSEFGFGSLNLTRADLIQSGNIIQLGYPPIRIDLINSLDGVDFKDCYAHREEMVYDENLMIRYIGLSDLVANKKASGRHRDLDDIQNLLTSE